MSDMIEKAARAMYERRAALAPEYARSLDRPWDDMEPDDRFLYRQMSIAAFAGRVMIDSALSEGGGRMSYWKEPLTKDLLVGIMIGIHAPLVFVLVYALVSAVFGWWLTP